MKAIYSKRSRLPKPRIQMSMHFFASANTRKLTIVLGNPMKVCQQRHMISSLKTFLWSILQPNLYCILLPIFLLYIIANFMLYFVAKFYAVFCSQILCCILQAKLASREFVAESNDDRILQCCLQCRNNCKSLIILNTVQSVTQHDRSP